jgi:hypothetical protein
MIVGRSTPLPGGVLAHDGGIGGLLLGEGGLAWGDGAGELAAVCGARGQPDGGAG